VLDPGNKSRGDKGWWDDGVAFIHHVIPDLIRDPVTGSVRDLLLPLPDLRRDDLGGKVPCLVYAEFRSSQLFDVVGELFDLFAGAGFHA
jgi:hypothetical protein